MKYTTKIILIFIVIFLVGAINIFMHDLQKLQQTKEEVRNKISQIKKECIEEFSLLDFIDYKQVNECVKFKMSY